ncbi:MAG: protein kinase domain-containing protein [Microcoleaceae cyanobacterium]
MSYCLNPHCTHHQNPDDSKFCLTCGAKLLLRERYKAIKPIGHGGFGKTFLAVDEDKPSRPPCVIKQFFPQSQGTQNSTKAIELFHQEAIRLDQLGKHPQIPDLLAHFEQDGNQYLVQEYINGENLEQELEQQGTFNEVQIWELLNDLLPVLQFVHQNQVIHRDIKPANIIRRRGLTTQTTGVHAKPGELVLVDFGAAKVVTQAQLPGMGTVIGSPEYIAPEQTRGQAMYASDVYSLGVTCLYLLTQISPFDLFDIHEDQWIWRDYLKGQPFSMKLGQILDKMVTMTPAQRYPSALAVLKDLHPDGIPARVLQNLQLSPQATQPVARQPVARPPIATSSPQIPTQFRIQHPQPPQPPQPQKEKTFSRVAPLQGLTWDCLYTLKGHRNSVTAVVFSPDGATLASGSQDQTIEIWQLNRGKRWYTLTGHTNWVTSLSFSPDGKLLASGSRDKTIEIWDMVKGKRWFTLAGHAAGVEVVRFSLDGKLLASGSRDKTIEIWDMTKGKRWFTLTGHEDYVYGLSFSPNGQILASGGRDNSVRLWDLHRARELYQLPGHADWVRTVAFSPDGQILASGSRDGMIKLWEIQNGRWTIRRTLRADRVDVFALTFSPDGQLLASGNRDGNLDLWEVESGTLLETSAAHREDILAVDFSQDGQLLATASYDSTVKIWQPSPTEE